MPLAVRASCLAAGVVSNRPRSVYWTCASRFCAPTGEADHGVARSVPRRATASATRAKACRASSRRVRFTALFSIRFVLQRPARVGREREFIVYRLCANRARRGTPAATGFAGSRHGWQAAVVMTHDGTPDTARYGLLRDAVGGANLALAMLPKAMAYASVAGVPPVYGLYASCAAPALAVAFGSNRLLFTGPVGVMTVLVLGSLHHFAESFSPAYIELAASLTLMVGALILLFAAARLGFLVRAIPTPVTEGFIAAAALLIIGTQVGPALGAPPPSTRAGIHLPAFLAEAVESVVPARRSRPRALRRLYRHRAVGAEIPPANS